MRLEPDYQAAYDRWRSQVVALQRRVVQGQPNVQQLQAEFLILQQVFQQQLRPAEETSPAAVQSLLRSVHTEINKQLRLLAMDLSFLGAARQPTTVQQRQAQIRDRLQQLLRYGVVLGLEPEASEESKERQD